MRFKVRAMSISLISISFKLKTERNKNYCSSSCYQSCKCLATNFTCKRDDRAPREQKNEVITSSGYHWACFKGRHDAVKVWVRSYRPADSCSPEAVLIMLTRNHGALHFKCYSEKLWETSGAIRSRRLFQGRETMCCLSVRR